MEQIMDKLVGLLNEFDGMECGKYACPSCPLGKKIMNDQLDVCTMLLSMKVKLLKEVK